jgi:beta-1,4-N-acetylglucosaminyltransferase
MIFLTVGTQFPLDRLVKAVDEAIGQGLLNEEIWAQIGQSSYQPRHFRKSTDFLDKQLFDQWMGKASKVISHAGIGSITMALDAAKPLLVMPRLRKYGEVVNNHQVDIAQKFEQFGYLLAAYDIEELPEKIEALKSFVPQKRNTQPEKVAERISRFLNQFTSQKPIAEKGFLPEQNK